MIKKSLAIALLSVTVLAMGACSSDDDDDTPAADAGTTGTGTTDTGTTGTGTTDTGTTDTGTTDTGTTDTGTTDTGTTDTGTTDTGTTDTGTTDTGTTDTGTTDTGTTDTGTTDTGTDTDAGTDSGSDTDGTTDTTGGTTDGGTDGGGSDPNGLQAALQANDAGAVFGPLQEAGFVLNISRDSAWTTFLPNDEAVNAAVAAGATFDSAALAAHVHDEGAIPDLNAIVGTTLTMNSNGGSPMYTVENGPDGGLTFGGFNVVSDAINTGGPGFIYIIDGVLPQGN